MLPMQWLSQKKGSEVPHNMCFKQLKEVEADKDAFDPVPCVCLVKDLEEDREHHLSHLKDDTNYTALHIQQLIRPLGKWWQLPSSTYTSAHRTSGARSLLLSWWWDWHV